MPDIDHLIATKQFYAAAWKVILPCEGTRPPEAIAQVSEIVGKAIKVNCISEIRKIMKAFDKWVDQETSELAVTVLNETTDIDLQPDVL